MFRVVYLHELIVIQPSTEVHIVFTRDRSFNLFHFYCCRVVRSVWTLFKMSTATEEAKPVEPYYDERYEFNAPRYYDFTNLEDDKDADKWFGTFPFSFVSLQKSES